LTARVLLLLAASLGAACSGTIRLAGVVEHPVTADGWRLTVERFPPAAGSPPRALPVVICHGFGANRSYFKIDEERSLPAVLARSGYDVWLLDLRGRDDAGTPGFWFGAHTYTYSVDDYIRYDVDAALAHVTRATGKPRVIWIGHSMGGMVAYARAGAYGDARIAELITVGSPGAFAPMSRVLLQAYEASGAMSILPAVPLAFFARIYGALATPLVPTIFLEPMFYPGNLHHGEAYKMARYTATNLAKPETRQLLLGSRRGEFVSADGRLSYSRTLGAITIPTLVVGGRRDQLADPMVIRKTFEHLGSADKELLIVGRATGFSEDYGHTDLVVGEPAAREVFPRILDWLARHEQP
jgi:polyhydroxyalkanoate synthase